MTRKKRLLCSAIIAVVVILMPFQAFAGGKKEKPQGSKPASESSVEKDNTGDSSAGSGQDNTARVVLGNNENTVATVNGAAIPKAKLDSQVMTIVQQYAQQGQTLNEQQLGEVRSKVLDQLIDQELLYQDAVKKGISATEEEIKTQIDGIKKQFGSDDEYLKALKQQNISEDYLKADVKMNIVLNKYVEQKFKPEVTVTEDEDAAFYGQNPDYFTQPEQVRASHILIKVDKEADDAAKAEAKKKIEKVQQRLASGEEFSDLAREVSEGPSGPNGGDLGFFGRGQMVKPFEDAVFALKKGEVSGIVETQFGYHIIKLTGKKEKGLIPFDQVKAQIHDHLLQTKLSQVLAKYIDTLKADADIEKQTS